MTKIYQFRYAADNLGYLLADRRTAMAIDGGAVSEMVDTLKRLGLTLRFVVNTHDHADHTMGSRELAERTGAELLGHRQLLEMGTVMLDSTAVRILATPGHTADSKTFVCGDSLITGDTLFNGTVGNCFSGDLSAFYHSIRQLMAFPDDTWIYAGHDYVRESVAFARTLPIAADALDAYLDRYDPLRVVSIIGQERQVNPYVMFNDPELVNYLKAKDLPVDTERQRWESIMTLG